MKIKKILVVVEGSSSSLAHLESGLNLAKSLDATLTALCVIPLYSPTLGIGAMHGGWYIGEDMVENQRRSALSAAKKMCEASERLAEKVSTKLHWVQQLGDVVDITCNEVQYHDVLVVAKPDTVSEPHLHTGDLNHILLSCGKPVLILPRSTPFFKTPPQNILFAWDKSREALQAIHQSMPFLEAATSVKVVSAYKHKERKQTIEEQADDMAAYLVCHNINASSVALPKQRNSTGKLLANYAKASEVDLIVMGAYGRSRLTELVMGGATRHMLRHATVPVLFAH